MRKNRKIPKRMSVLTRTTARFGSIIGILFVEFVFRHFILWYDDLFVTFDVGIMRG